jgi:hypothetical protein
MPDENQTEVPQSFMALFVERGRLKPGVTREVIESRYALCEDMACMLIEQAQTVLFDQGISEMEVLRRCHQGLLADAAVISASESDWVIYRLAELLCWAPPDLSEAG